MIMNSEDDISIERQLAVYKSVVKPADTSRIGTSMADVVAKLCEKDETLLARLTRRDRYVPGGCGVPHDVRIVVSHMHQVAYPRGESYKTFGMVEVRRVYKSPRIDAGRRQHVKKSTGYARGWAVRGYTCA